MSGTVEQFAESQGRNMEDAYFEVDLSTRPHTVDRFGRADQG